MDDLNRMTLDPIGAWNKEYRRQGIPSSHRSDPSGVLQWGLANFPYLAHEPLRSAVDLGCGTGRNSAALASKGLARVSGMDFSTTALDIARSRSGSNCLDFVQGDVTKPLPFESNAFDLAVDIFVYFHQLADQDRRNYRREIHRVLRPGGLLLVSLATDNDGYYSQCPDEPVKDVPSTVRLVWDPVAAVGNILLSTEQLLMEFDDLFSFEMIWLKKKSGMMHGLEYTRETIATIWRAKKL